MSNERVREDGDPMALRGMARIALWNLRIPAVAFELSSIGIMVCVVSGVRLAVFEQNLLITE